MVLTVIPVAEMQHHCGDLTQTFLSPDLPAARVLIVWVLVTPKEPGGVWGAKWVVCRGQKPITPLDDFTARTGFISKTPREGAHRKEPRGSGAR